MKQALRIFSKDVRHQSNMILLLWADLGVLVLIAAAGRDIWLIRAFELIAIALAGLSIFSSVNDEAPVGENEFWMTRPYHRRSLMAGKLLFVSTIVGVPMFLANYWAVLRIYPDQSRQELFLDSFLQLVALLLTVFISSASRSRMTLVVVIEFYTLIAANDAVLDGSARPKYLILALLAMVVTYLLYSDSPDLRDQDLLRTFGALLAIALIVLPWVSTPWDIAWEFQRLTGPSQPVEFSVDRGRQLTPKNSYATYWHFLIFGGYSGGSETYTGVPINVSGISSSSRLRIVAERSLGTAGDGRTDKTEWNHNEAWLDHTDTAHLYLSAILKSPGTLSDKDSLKISVDTIAEVFEEVSKVVLPADGVKHDESQPLKFATCEVSGPNPAINYSKLTCHPRSARSWIDVKVGDFEFLEIRPKSWGAAMFTAFPPESWRMVSPETGKSLYAGELPITITEYKLKGFARPQLSVPGLRFADLPEAPRR